MPGANTLYDDLFPFTLTRSALDIRVGILTLREKWGLLAGRTITEAELEGHSIPVSMIPSRGLLEAIDGGELQQHMDAAERLDHPWQIFQINDRAIRHDFTLLTQGRESAPLPASNSCTYPKQIFLEHGARIDHAIINASTGPVYIGKNAEVMEGCLLRGPLAICEGAVVKMGTKIYGATTIGPHCMVGGEIKNSMMFGYSNKAHDGYLGDAVIGEWCNLGAGTSNSNLKNNAGNIRIWNPGRRQFLDAGQKCGLMMGDYSRSAIHTAFNTGTATGVCCNVFGSGLTPTYLPSFSWGVSGSIKYAFEKALTDIAQWKKMKHQQLTDVEITRLKLIFENE